MVNKDKIEEAVRLLLEGIGEDCSREGLLDTPGRVARMYEEIFEGMDQNAAEHLSKTFTVRDSGMVLEKDISFYSTCEHHLMPFFGKVHIAYLPYEQVVGISKLARTVEVYARRLQIQERLTSQIADAVMEHLRPRGAMVMVQAEHTCMTMRGVKKPGSQTVTLAVRGEFKEDRQLQETFLQFVR